jgi:Leucine-rich repeat (LRR) protein
VKESVDTKEKSQSMITKKHYYIMGAIAVAAVIGIALYAYASYPTSDPSEAPISILTSAVRLPQFVPTCPTVNPFTWPVNYADIPFNNPVIDVLTSAVRSPQFVPTCPTLNTTTCPADIVASAGWQGISQNTSSATSPSPLTNNVTRIDQSSLGRDLSETVLTSAYAIGGVVTAAVSIIGISIFCKRPRQIRLPLEMDANVEGDFGIGIVKNEIQTTCTFEDIIRFWLALAEAAGLEVDFSDDILDGEREAIEKATDFSEWVKWNHDDLKKVEKLDLTWKDISTLPPEIGYLENLKTLDLEGNFLTTLPPEIGNLVKLEYLGLHANFLKKLPPEIGSLKSLQELDLALNDLTELPPEMGDLVKLRFLHLESNGSLEGFPSQIGNLATLRGLYLDECNIKEFPSEIRNLTQLEDLVLPGNPLEKFPEIENLPSLKAIFLRDHNLNESTEEMEKLHAFNENHPGILEIW